MVGMSANNFHARTCISSSPINASLWRSRNAVAKHSLSLPFMKSGQLFNMGTLYNITSFTSTESNCSQQSAGNPL